MCYMSSRINCLTVDLMIKREPRYNLLSSNQGLYRNEMISLKQNIERDRLQLNQVDKKIDANDQEIQKALNELVRCDKCNNWSE